jgi:hypothetical protein
MDVITFISFFIFGLYLAGRVVVRYRVVSNVPWWAGDSVHFAVGAFVSRLPMEWAWLVTTVYITYQVFDWLVNRDTVAKDVAAFLGGLLVGLGYDVVKF